MENIRYGFVLFDDDHTHDTGWVLREGDPLLRIVSTAELSSDTVWWTNLSYEAANLSGLQGARFRRGTYLSHDVSRIWQELGLDEGADYGLRIRPDSVFDGKCDNGLELRLRVANWVFRKTIEIANDFLPFAAPPLNDLAHGLRERIFPEWRRFFIDEAPPEYYRMALEAADKYYQPVPRTISPSGDSEAPLPKTIRLPVDRVYHAWTLLHMPIPIGGWRDLKDGVKLLNRKSPEFIREWLMSNPGALLRVTMKRCSEEMESIINYGANIERNARSGHWLTAIELDSLMDHCEFTLHECVIAEKVQTPIEFLEKRGVMSTPITWDLCKVRSPSYPFHLFMDNLWRSFCGPIPRMPKGQKNPFSAFLRSADRMILMRRASSLQQKGIAVVGYGSGGILIQSPRGQPQDWLPALLSAALLPPVFPAGIFSLEEAQEMIDLYSSEKGSFLNTGYLKICLLLGDLNSIIYLGDELSLAYPGNNDEVADE